MRRARVLMVLVSVALVAAPAMADNARELVNPAEPLVSNPVSPVSWRAPEAILYDNGPLVTHAGGGAGGADASVLQTALGMSTFGFGAAVASGFRVADDFTVTDPTGWQVDTLTFFAYQTGSTTASTLNALNVRIWSGAPNAGGTVVWGDTTTNVLNGSTWTNIYRVTDTDIAGSTRPIMTAVAAVNTLLPPGTYWVDVQFGGSLSSGPWAPPISILGVTTTGNALQYDPGAATWNQMLDTGASAVQGLPFIVDGSVPGQPTATPDPNAGMPIPTMSRWGIAAMLVLLAGAAILLITRRS